MADVNFGRGELGLPGEWHGRPARESRAGCACHNRADAGSPKGYYGRLAKSYAKKLFWGNNKVAGREHVQDARATIYFNLKLRAIMSV